MTQTHLLKLAQQGDASAITTLLNRALQLKGITAKTTLKEGYLQIVLEAEQVPEQQVLVAFIRKSITTLAAASIKGVKIYGRQIGEELPGWNQEFELVTQSLLGSALEDCGISNDVLPSPRLSS